MHKLACILTLSLVITVPVFTQSNGPLRGRYSETSSIVPVSDNDVEVWGRFVQRGGDLTYWLYRLPSYMTFDSIVAELCEYLENEHLYGINKQFKGWNIVWDMVREWNPNTGLETSIKTMMRRLNRNVSVCIVERGGNAPTLGMMIHYYDSTTDTYTTLHFPCYS
jgi:hypothetical protein